MGLEVAEEGSLEIHTGFWLKHHPPVGHRRASEDLAVQFNIPGSTAR